MNRVIYVIASVCVLLMNNSCINRADLNRTGSAETSLSLSSEDVTAFVMDVNGYMWIGTSDGLNLFDGHRYHQFLNSENDTNSLVNNRITDLFSDSKKNIWIGTKNGICIYKGNGKFQNIPIENSQFSDVAQIQESSGGNITINANGDLYAYDSVKGIFVHKFEVLELEKRNLSFYPDDKNGFWLIAPEHIRHLNASFAEDKTIVNEPYTNIVVTTMSNNFIWIASRLGGLKKIDIAKGELIPVRTELPVLPNYLVVYKDNLLINSKNGVYNFDIQKDSLSHINDFELALNFNHLQVSCWYLDANRNLWVGLSNGGYLYLNPSINQINALKKLKLYTETKDQSTIALTTDRNHNIWGALADNRLFYFDKPKNEIRFFQLDSLFFDFYLHRIRKILTYKDKVVISTDLRAIICRFNNGQLITEKSIRLGILKMRIEDIILDSSGNIVIGTNRKNIMVAHMDNEKMETYPISASISNTNCRLKLLSTGEILVFLQGFHIAIFNPTEKKLYESSIKLSDLNKGSVPTIVFEDSQKRIWLGTNNGLYAMDTKNKKIIPVEIGSRLSINSIQEDKADHFWIGTNRGLMEYIPEKNESYSYSTEVVPKEKPEIYNNRSSCMYNDSVFVFGHTKGCTIFNPFLMVENTMPKLYIEKVNIRKKDEVLGVDLLQDKAISDLHLKYNENNVDISFASINYSFSPQYFYFYKLDGLDNQWIRSRSVGNVSYSNLPHGQYTFKVKLAYSPNADAFLEKQINISIARAPWFSIPAMVFYALLILAIVFYMLRLYVRAKTEHIVATMAQRDKEREHWTSQMNMNFFANISHEFRNPLSMIAGPISTMSQDKSLPKSTHHLISIVSRSVQQMLNLIDQMLNFNKLENDVLKMQVGWYDIVYEINAIIEQIEICTNEKNIQIKRTGLDAPYFTIIDRNKLDEILGNIFSNALKHTPQNGFIQIEFKTIAKADVLKSFNSISSGSEEYVYISVQDSGPGIPDDQQEDIFKRYYQVASSSSGIKNKNRGTGIGLYYVKKLVELHHGLIKVKNAPAGGAVFYFALPVGQEAYKNDDWITKSNSVEDTYTRDISFPANGHEDAAPMNVNLPKLLIVEDDTQVSYYLRTIFNKDYNVVNKYDAESALESLQQIEPDIILSDVVMEGMSGYDFCKTIKNDRAFCHIPIILLTAKSQIDEQIAGLETGANAYVTKPFDPLYLKTLVQSQLKNRNYIRELINKTDQKEKLVDSLSPQDSNFIKELYEIMDKMIADDDLNLTTVSEQLHMSRAKFNYKMKGLTGETPSVFFKKYKLNKAASLLKEGKYNVSEVAYMTGFGTIAHFSVSFKKQFGVNPSEYK